MAVGSWIGSGFTALGVTLPAYIGAMLAAALRNLDDVTGGSPSPPPPRRPRQRRARPSSPCADDPPLWEIANLALPWPDPRRAGRLIALLCLWPTFRLMGGLRRRSHVERFCGFMLGTTANAMRTWGAHGEVRPAPAPTSCAMVGAFFIDFTNAVIITAFLNLWSRDRPTRSSRSRPRSGEGPLERLSRHAARASARADDALLARSGRREVEALASVRPLPGARRMLRERRLR